jgi:hypothetical protein
LQSLIPARSWIVHSSAYLKNEIDDAETPPVGRQSCGDESVVRNKLSAGDYNRAEAGRSDRRVWSETGCTCVLTTSLRDILR